MGANCCIASKEKHQPNQVEISTYRASRHSPSWSFRWDNRTHIEDIMENPSQITNHNSETIRPENKRGVSVSDGGHYNGANPSDVLQRLKRQKSNKTEAQKASKDDVPCKDLSVGRNASLKGKDSSKLAVVTGDSSVKTSVSVASTPVSVCGADPSSSGTRSLPTDEDPSRKARRSPGYQLYRQVSDSKIPSLKSQNESSSPEGRKSSAMLSVCSNDMSAGGSQGGSSDGWSMRTFSELVASSQRERWSVDSELLGSVSSKGTKSPASQPPAASPDQLVCEICSKSLRERTSWGVQEMGVVAVLFCGHVYHSDCLESMTAEVDKYDPPCPVCTHGEKDSAKLFEKMESKLKNKIQGNAAVDFDLAGASNSKNQKKNGKGTKLGESHSMKSSFSRPFLRRHFSIGARPPRPMCENEPTGKKGFRGVRPWRD